MTTETVTILEIVGDMVRHSGGGVAHISNFPDAQVGQTWVLTLRKFKIIHTELVG